jgi:hypothetical protein
MYGPFVQRRKKPKLVARLVQSNLQKITDLREIKPKQAKETNERKGNYIIYLLF